MFDLVAHLRRQMAFSRATYGPGARTDGVINHITKELQEVKGAPDHAARVKEWTDVAILALDGLTRELLTPQLNRSTLMSEHPTIDQAALDAVDAIVAKQNANELRNWPDWRTADPNKAIEHDRSGEQAPGKKAEVALQEIIDIGRQYSVASGPAWAMLNVAANALKSK
jgi:hypothetical protein